MKYKITLLLYIIATSSVFSQKTERIRYEKILSFNFPSYYTKTDTLGLLRYMGTDSTGIYQCIVAADKTFGSPQNKAELENSYRECLKGMALNLPGYSFVDSSMISLGELRALKSTFENSSSDPETTMENLMIFLDGNLFTFVVVLPGKDEEVVERLFGSIEIDPSITANNQFIAQEKSRPELIGELIGYGCMVIISIGIIIIIARRANKS